MYYLDENLYVDISGTDKMCKSFNVDELLSEANLKWFDTELVKPPYFMRGDRTHYYPIDVATSIRSLYSNLVLCKKDSCYTITQCRQKCPHRGLDLVMYETSRNVCDYINKSPEFNMDIISDIMSHSIFQLIGFITPSNCPTFYSHVILPDDYIEKLVPYLAEDCEFRPIEEVRDMGVNPISILETLIVLERRQ